MPRLLPTLLLPATSLLLLAQANSPKPAYDMSLSRAEKIKLAKSAAPPEISDPSTVYVLDPSGYVKVQDGSNGFSCFVDRQTPMNQEPTCFDAEGSATTLPTRLFAEEQRAKGGTEDQIKVALDAGYKSGRFLAPKKPGIVYMLSDSIYLFIAQNNQLVHAPPHLMFYAPYATEKDLGSPPPGMNMPRLIRAGQPDAVMIVFPAQKTSATH
jgi:hypothetical protein